VNLAGHVARAVVAQEILIQQRFEFWSCFPFFPTRAELLHKLRLDVLVSGRAVFQEIAEPIDGAALIFHENGQLADVLYQCPLLVVFVDLLGQKIHAVAFGEFLRQALPETRRNLTARVLCGRRKRPPYGHRGYAGRARRSVPTAHPWL
jgi:hypothetical protein